MFRLGLIKKWQTVDFFFPEAAIKILLSCGNATLRYNKRQMFLIQHLYWVVLVLRVFHLS